MWFPHQFTKPLYNTLACQNIAVGWSPSLPLHSWDRTIAHTVLTNAVFFRSKLLSQSICSKFGLQPSAVNPRTRKAVVSRFIVLFVFFSGEIPGNHKHTCIKGKIVLSGPGINQVKISFSLVPRPHPAFHRTNSDGKLAGA